MSSGFDHQPQDAGLDIFSLVPTILWERKWLILTCFFLGTIAAGVAIYFLPTQYRSTSTMVVQGSELTNSTIDYRVGDNAARRVATIRQELISRPDLIELINQNNLYPKKRRSESLSSIIDTMRQDIEITTVETDMAGSANNYNAIAFQLSFDYSSPDEAQLIAQKLMEKLVGLYSSQSSEQATNNVEFLADQARTLEREIAEVEGQMAAITSRNGIALSGAVPIVSGSGGYQAQIAMLERENRDLMRLKSGEGAIGTDPGVQAARNALAAARAIYSETHPDVVLAKRQLAEAQASAASNATGLQQNQAVDQQIAFNNSQIAALRSAIGREAAARSASIAAQSRGPAVQQQVSQLNQRLSGLNSQYQEISAKMLNAEASLRANDEQLGQRLTVVDPPALPEEPHSPNRLLIGVAGIAGGLGLGLLLAFALEFFFRPIRSPQAFARIIGGRPLSVIPVIDSVPNKPRVLRRLLPWRKAKA